MAKILMKVDVACYPNPGNMAIGIVIYKDGELFKKNKRSYWLWNQ